MMKLNWMHSLIFRGISIGSLQTLLILYLSSVGYDIARIGLVLTLSNLLSMISSPAWGYVIDKTKNYIVIILLSYMMTTVLLFIMYILSFPLAIIIAFILINLFGSGSGISINLFVAHSYSGKTLVTGLSRRFMYFSIGNILSLGISSIVTNYFTIRDTFLILSLSALISFLIVFLSLKDYDTNLPFYKNSTKREGLLDDFKLMLSIVPLLVLFLSFFIFNFGSTLFRVSYPAAMYSIKLSNSIILGILALNSTVQSISYYFMHIIINRLGEVKSLVLFSIIRGLSYGIIGVFYFLLLEGKIELIIFLYIMIPIYIIAAGISFSVINTSISSLLIKLSNEDIRGKVMGVNNLLSGISALIGSATSGYISYFFGYYTTFIVAGSLLVINVMLIKLIRTE